MVALRVGYGLGHAANPELFVERVAVLFYRIDRFAHQPCGVLYGESPAGEPNHGYSFSSRARGAQGSMHRSWR